MALPVILVSSTDGAASDSLCSGAGPSTAISGSTGRTRSAATQTHFGFFGATDDFSVVATDGSAALFMSIATAGQRNLSALQTAIKNTRQTGSDAAITIGTAILVVGDTTGWTAGDVIKVAGAGAAGVDLYSTILTVDSGIQATLNDNAGTTVAAAAWENPKQAILPTGQEVNTGATNTAWAIGGKRLTISSTTSKKLLDNNGTSGDAMPGWIIELESGFTDTFTATQNWYRAGDTTSGPIVLRGASGAATMPVITFTNNGVGFILRSGSKQIIDLELRNTNATKTASIAVQLESSEEICRGLRIKDATGKFWKGILIGTSVIGGSVEDCDIRNTASHGIEGSGIGAACQAINNFIASCGGVGILTGSSDHNICCRGNIIVGCTSHGIHCNSGSSSTVSLSPLYITNNTLDANGGDGIRFTNSEIRAMSGMLIENNVLSNNTGYGVNLNAATAEILGKRGVRIRGNAYYNNTSGDINPSALSAYETGETSGSDPAYTSTGSQDYSIGTALRAKGYPLGGTQKVGNSSGTWSYVDQGASQRQEAAGGGVTLVRRGGTIMKM